MPNLGAHASLFATQFSATFARLFDSHERFSDRKVFSSIHELLNDQTADYAVHRGLGEVHQARGLAPRLHFRGFWPEKHNIGQ
jgi:hypothetical protein